jgi:hypothetical protein
MHCYAIPAEAGQMTWTNRKHLVDDGVNFALGFLLKLAAQLLEVRIKRERRIPVYCQASYRG